MRALLHVFILLGVASLSLCCSGGGGSGSALSHSGDGISGTGDFKLSKVSLSHESFGSGNQLDFELNSLAPILRLSFQEPLGASPREMFKVSVTDLNLQQSIELLPGQKNIHSLKLVQGEDQRDFYIHIEKSASLVPGQFELRPGHHYRYVVEAIDGKTLEHNGVVVGEISGYLRIKNLTFTYLGDFENGDTLVRDGQYLQGIQSLEPEFLVHSRYPIEGLPSEQGPLSILDLSIGGLKVLKPDSEDHKFLTILESNSTSTRLKLDKAPLSWGQKIELQVKPKVARWLTESGEREISQADVPSILTLETRQL